MSSKPRQGRSQRSIDRLLEAGRAILNHTEFDQISVQEIAQEAGSSIGSFYHHFGNKENFFKALVREMAEKREAIAMANYASTATQDLPIVLARGAFENHRRYRGLMRSAIRQHLGGGDVWQPITRMGQHIADEYVRRIEADLQRSLTGREKERVAFAFIWLYGILAQSVLDLNTLSAYRIDEAVFETEAIASFSSLLTRALEG